MTSNSGRAGGIRKSVIAAVPATLTMLALVATTSPALATPKGAYAIFADCPVHAATGCIYAKTESGHFTIGKETVPIEKP